MQNIEHSDGSKENMSQKTSAALVQSQHDCLMVRVCQKPNVGKQQRVHFLSDEHRIRSFQASLCNPSECTNYRSEKNVEKN